MGGGFLKGKPKAPNKYLAKARAIIAVLSHFFGVVAFDFLTFLIKKLLILRYELGYKLHLRARNIHDTLVVKSRAYKVIVENKYAMPVKRAVATGFVASLVVFVGIQYLLPIFNPFRAGDVEAASATAVWDTQADFTNNNGATNDTTKYNVSLSSSADAVALQSFGQEGTGGTITYTDSSGLNPRTLAGGGPYVGGYNVHIFTSSGTFVAPTGTVSSVEALLAGGGGAGGGNNASYLGGGGGAGGLLSVSNSNIASGNSYPIVVGVGGTTCGSTSGCYGHDGTNTTFNGLTALKGGGGGTYQWSGSGGSGVYGSGGGAGGGIYTTAVGTSGQGNSGGSHGGGGGGSSSAGASDGAACTGGNGTGSTISGVATTYSSGGAGYCGTKVAGASSTGAGGGAGFAGGSGVVIIRYLTPPKLATIGGTGSSVGLRKDLCAGTTCSKLAKWDYISFNLNSALISGQYAKFLLRTSNDGINWQIYDRNGSPVADANIDTAFNSTYFGQTYGDASPYTGSLSSVPASRYAEVIVRLYSNSATSPVLNNASLGYSPLKAPDGIVAKKADNTDISTTASYTNETTVGLKVTVPAMDGIPTETLTPQIEMVTASTVAALPAFASSTVSGSTLPSAAVFTPTNVSYVQDTAITTPVDVGTITGLSPGSSYKLQLRFIDSSGRMSQWSSGSSVSYTFSVEQNAPTISTFTINSGATYAKSATVNLGLSASDTGGSNLSQMQFSNNGTDWGKTADDSGNITDTGWATYATSYSWKVAKGAGDGGTDGSRTVYARVRDNAGNISGRVTHTSSADFSGGTASSVNKNNDRLRLLSQPTTSTYTIAASADDACEFAVLDYTNTSIIPFWSNKCALRWQLDIPSGAIVSNAYIKVVGSMASTTDNGVDVSIFDADNSENYSTSFSSRPVMSGSVYWNVPSIVVGQVYNSADLSTLLSDYLARPGYSSGNYVGFKTVVSGSTTAGAKRVYSYDSGSNRPQLVVTYSGGDSAPYVNSGTYTSPTITNAVGEKYGTISWDGYTPSESGGQAVRFQVASNNDNATWNYVGPDGTASTYYTNTDTKIWSGHDGNRYIRYKGYLQTANTGYTPTIDSVSIATLSSNSDSIILDTQSPSGTVSLRGGGAYVKSSSVVLDLSVTDAGPSGVKDFALSNDGETWSSYVDWSDNYKATGSGYPWTLANGDGAKKVYVKYRDNALNIVGNYDKNWIDGQGNLAGIQVRNSDLSGGKYQWKTSDTICSDSQCYSGVDSYWGPKRMLSSDNGIDFSEYPARAACQVIDGRLPSMGEVFEIDKNQEIYGDNFHNYTGSISNSTYYSSVEAGAQFAMGAVFTHGGDWSATGSKTSSYYVRCVRDSSPSVTPIFIGATLDENAPASSVTLNPANPSGNNDWYKVGKPTVTILSADAVSKTNKVYYEFKKTTDAAPVVGSYANSVTNSTGDANYSQDLDLSTVEGDMTLYWYADDNAGNVENFHSKQIKIDVHAPSTSYSITPDLPNGANSWYTETAPAITLTAEDTGATENSGVDKVYYAWESDTNSAGCTTPKYWNSTLSKCFTPYTIDVSPNDGAHTFYYFTMDLAGNTDSVHTKQIKYISELPSVPSDFRAPTGDTETDGTHIKLYWNSSSSVSGIVAYQILRKRELDSWGQRDATVDLSGSTTSYLDSNDTTAPNGLNILETGQRYNYKIRAQDSAGNWSAFSVDKVGYTADFISPTPVSGVVASACDGTLYNSITNPSGKCSEVANRGFEMKLTWNSSGDTGVGMSRYVIYRSTTNSSVETEWDIVGVLNYVSGQMPIWFDNDTNNDATFAGGKVEATTRLNDSSTYYYRVRAYDLTETGNPTDLFPSDPNLFMANFSSDTTPDVTAPSVPSNVVASPLGLDPSGTHQRIHLTWSASVDRKARSQEIVSGTVHYNIYEATSEDGTYNLIKTTTSLLYDIDGLDEFTYYYYKVDARDAVPNYSEKSSYATAKTASNSVPTTPTDMLVTTKTGNPNADSAVGHQNVITFNGSYAKNCLNSVGCLTKYEVYRSTVNYQLESDWISSAEKISEIEPVVPKDDRTSTVQNNQGQVVRSEPYSVTDTGQVYPATSGAGLGDGTTYYYRVRALDNTPDPVTGEACPENLVGVQCNYHSPMTTIEVGTVHAGWDTTADATAPTVNVANLELNVKDTHANSAVLRNVITWKVIDTPLRKKLSYQNCSVVSSDAGVDYCSDFAKYEIHREVYDATNILIPEMSETFEINDINSNIYIDTVDVTYQNDKFKYYLVVVDDAKDNFLYENGTPINDYSNKTSKIYWDGSITPANAHAVVSNIELGSVGVASATITWSTDQDTDSLVEYRSMKKSGADWVVDDSHEFTAVGHRERGSSHSVYIFGLKPNTRYEYRVISRNYPFANETVVSSGLPVLTTDGFNINAGSSSTTTSTAEVKWTTNLDASSAFIEYQLNKQPGDTAQGGTAGVEPKDLSSSPRSHTVVVKGLRSNRTYTYKIKSISTDGFVAETEFLTFKTRNFDSAQFSLAPASSNVADRNITSTTAQIVWQTANATTSWVDYGTSSGVFSTSAGNDNLTTTHVVTLEGLIPGTKYYYHVRVKDENELEYTSQEYSFTAVIKPKISNMQVKNVTPYTVTIAWETNVDTETVINWGKTSGYGEKHGTAGTSKVHQVTVDNLEDNQEYHYQIVAHDEAGNEVAGSDSIVRTPIDTEGPKISNAKIDILPMGESDTTATIIVSWQTNKPSTTLVEYDQGVMGSGTYTNRSVEDKTLNNTHTVIVKNLQVASSYHYRIVSADRRGNTTRTDDYTFVTPSKEKSIVELIVKSLEDTFSWTRNLNQFFGNIFKRFTGKS